MRAVLFVSIVASVVACVGENPDTSSSSSSSGGSSGGSSSSGGPSARTVQCNEKRCAAGEVCCLTFGDSSVDKAECTPEAACSSGALVCDGPSDCEAGLRCCAKTRGGSVQYGPSSCSKECDASNLDAELCNENRDCTSGSCVPPRASTTPINLKECK